MDAKILISTIALVISAASFVFTIYIDWRGRADIVNDFLAEIGSPKAIQARNHVYNTEYIDPIDIHDEWASYIVNFYHRWGSLAKHKYLPRWVFEDGNANGTIRIYNKLSPYIKAMKQHNGDDTYASGFEWLYKDLTSR